MVLLQNELGGIPMTGVPYKGNAPGLQDVIAGHVSVMFSDLLSALPHIRSGKLVALGVSTRQRVPAASEMQTLQEAGVPGYDASAWQMIVAPAKTPPEIVDQLNAELNAIVREPSTSRDINGRGHIAIVTPPVAELQRYVASEIVRWGKVVGGGRREGRRNRVIRPALDNGDTDANGRVLWHLPRCSPRIPAAAQDCPTKPVTIVIPFAAGGAGDILARMLSPRLEKTFGRPFVVENRPGAGGVIGAVYAAKAAPDGYTIMIAPSPTMAVNVTLYKKLPYDPATDFVPLAMAAQTPFVLVVNPSLPVKSVADLIKYVKEQKGKVSYATAGAGVPHHLFAELLKSMTGIEMSPVPYKGSAPAITDVMAGHIPLMFVDLGPSLSLIQAGKVRAVGVSTATRLPTLPDVPPINDTVKGFDVASWQMVVAPAKTPRPIVDRLHAELKSQFASPEMSARGRQDRHAADGDDNGARPAGVREIRDRALGQGGASGRDCRDAVGDSRRPHEWDCRR